MTTQEAIEIIKYASAFNADNSPLTDALGIAIEALEVQDVLISMLLSYEDEHICEEMCDDYEMNEWCEAHCRYTCPQKECYLKYAKFIIGVE